MTMFWIQSILITISVWGALAQADPYLPPEPEYPLFEYVRGCYFTNWGQYRQDQGKYVPEYYIPGLCTHIFYAFVVMDENYQLKPFEWNDDTNEGTMGNYERVNHLKKSQPDLKTLLSFGGYTFSQANAGLLSRMASTNETRRTFIKSVINFVRARGFDGFDIDWEYPMAEDRINFGVLLEEMKEAMEYEARLSGKPRLLLTAAVAAGTDKIETGYIPAIMAQTLDFVNVMTYDFHGSWESSTGFNSPLYDRNGDGMAVSSASNYWVSKGIPRKKILIGFGTYGRGWTLANAASQNGVGVPTVQSSPAQNYTKEAGVAAYYEICHLLNDPKTIRMYDSAQQSPYLVNGNVWFGYDDEQSFEVKLTWLKRNGFGGAFVWTLDQDDFLGHCPNSQYTKYPLISKIASRLGKELPTHQLRFNVNATVMPPEAKQWYYYPSTPWPQQPQFNLTSYNYTTSDFLCPGPGLFPDPTSCSNYYNCAQAGPTSAKMSCGVGTLFNPTTKFCDWPYNVPCNHK